MNVFSCVCLSVSVGTTQFYTWNLQKMETQHDTYFPTLTHTTNVNLQWNSTTIQGISCVNLKYYAKYSRSITLKPQVHSYEKHSRFIHHCSHSDRHVNNHSTITLKRTSNVVNPGDKTFINFNMIAILTFCI